MQQIEFRANTWVHPYMARIVPVLGRGRHAGLPKSVAWFLSGWSHHLNEPRSSLRGLGSNHELTQVPRGANIPTLMRKNPTEVGSTL